MPVEHIDLEPRAADFLALLRDLGHVDDATMERITSTLVTGARAGGAIGFDETRRVAAIALFEQEARMRPEAKELLGTEWSRLFA